MTIKELRFFDPSKIASSGQAFRIQDIDDSHTELVAFGHYLQIARLDESTFAFSCDEHDYNDIWHDYFDLSRDYEAVVKAISPDDSYLKAASEFGYGIRILRQDIFETVISYIISQRRSIPSITTSINKLSALCGEPIIVPKLEAPFVAPKESCYYAFPTPTAISKLSPEALADTSVGYRAPYIARASEDFASGKLEVDALKALDDNELYKVLMSMFGVGTKVANCIMLFAFARTARFPVDVWIQRIMDKYYGGLFDTSPYPDTAGIMQQFMFYYERKRVD